MCAFLVEDWASHILDDLLSTRSDRSQQVYIYIPTLPQLIALSLTRIKFLLDFNNVGL
jgi:hypothetical protein